MTHVELLPALQITLPSITLNFEELEAKVNSITETYTGLVVEEKDVPAIKSEMSGLNKIVEQLGEARKSAVARISAPIKEFEQKVKGLEASILKTRAFLDEQVKAHIAREREQRRAGVQFMIDALKDEHNFRDLNIPLQENWLNKSIKDKQIAGEVQGIILTHKKQQEERAALEQALRDRVGSIENHNKSMGLLRGYELPFSSFVHLQNMAMPLAEALLEIENAYAREDQRREAARLPPVQPPKEDPHFTDYPEEKGPAPEVAPMLRRSLSIAAVYDSANGPQINEVYQQLKALCLTCTVQIKEIGYAQ